MPVIPYLPISATIDTSALVLPRYAQIIRYDENAFFGINAPTNRERAVRKIWSKIDRDMVARELGAAQEDIEKTLGFPIGEKWFTDEQHHRREPIFLLWSHVRTLGTRAVTTVASGVALNHTADPAVIPATATTVTDVNELHFYQSGTDMEIYPSALTIAAGLINASFPRARLVKEDMQENPPTGWDYADTGVGGPFVQEVDIKRVYTDVANAGEFVWPLGKENCIPECGEDTEPACGYIRSSESGTITLLPDTTPSCLFCGATEVRVNYLAGLPLHPTAEDAIIHLAHARMAVMPCADSDPLMMLWRQDRFTPADVSQQRSDALWGVTEGAWRAWVYAVNNRRVRTTLL